MGSRRGRKAHREKERMAAYLWPDPLSVGMQEKLLLHPLWREKRPWEPRFLDTMPKTEKKEERIWIPSYEKREILKNTYGICACCGKKLALKTMTVDHGIPLNRGGTNAKENLVALCYDCNQDKGSDFYLPTGCYPAIKGTTRFQELTQYMVDWYQNLADDQKADLIRHPMISTKTMISIQLGAGTDFAGRKKKSGMGMIRGLTNVWTMVGKGLTEEVEAVTDCSLPVVKDYLVNRMANLRERPAQAGVYLCKKLSTDKLLMLVTCRYVEERAALYLYIPWADMSKTFVSPNVMTIVDILLRSLCVVAKKPVQELLLESSVPHALDRFLEMEDMDPFIASWYAPHQYDDGTMAVWLGRAGTTKPSIYLRRDWECT